MCQEDGDENEINHLCEEASIPIEQLIAKYNNSTDDDSEPSKPVNPLLAGLKKVVIFHFTNTALVFVHHVTGIYIMQNTGKRGGGVWGMASRGKK